MSFFFFSREPMAGKYNSPVTSSMQIILFFNNNLKGEPVNTNLRKRPNIQRMWKGALSMSLAVAVVMAALITGCNSNDNSVAGPTSVHSSVDLRTAGTFAVLAKSGISVTGVTSVTGDLGLSPAAASYLTGFSLIMDVTNTFSTSSLVVSPGKLYASDYTSPTPTKMTTAVSDMETAYTDAAGRTSPNHTELGAGDITSMTLSAGLYKWGTGVLISAAGVTLSGSSTDVWIFQVAQDLTVANGAIITLSGGAKSSNIFWQVAGQTTIGTTAAMKGVILCQTAIAMNTGATLNGRALAQTAVTLEGNTVINPAQ